jgi:hypothetical protein
MTEAAYTARKSPVNCKHAATAAKEARGRLSRNRIMLSTRALIKSCCAPLADRFLARDCDDSAFFLLAGFNDRIFVRLRLTTPPRKRRVASLLPAKGEQHG